MTSLAALILENGECGNCHPIKEYQNDKIDDNHCRIDKLKIKCGSWACEGIQISIEEEKTT